MLWSCFGKSLWFFLAQRPSTQSVEKTRPVQPNLKTTVLALPILAVLLGILYVFYLGVTHFDTAEHRTNVSWLPNGATNVSYYRSYSFTAYEFDISEEGFLEWADGWNVAPITLPESIWRYTKYTVAEPKRVEEAHTAMIASGYVHRSGQSSGGGMVVAFDREAQRAYFQSSPR